MMAREGLPNPLELTVLGVRSGWPSPWLWAAFEDLGAGARGRGFQYDSSWASGGKSS